MLWDGSLSFCQGTRSQQLAGGNTGTPRRALQAGGVNCIVPQALGAAAGPCRAACVPGCARPCSAALLARGGPVSGLQSDGLVLQSCSDSSVTPGSAFTEALVREQMKEVEN